MSKTRIIISVIIIFISAFMIIKGIELENKIKFLEKNYRSDILEVSEMGPVENEYRHINGERKKVYFQNLTFKYTVDSKEYSVTKEVITDITGIDETEIDNYQYKVYINPNNPSEVEFASDHSSGLILIYPGIALLVFLGFSTIKLIIKKFAKKIKSS